MSKLGKAPGEDPAGDMMYSVMSVTKDGRLLTPEASIRKHRYLELFALCGADITAAACTGGL